MEEGKRKFLERNTFIFHFRPVFKCSICSSVKAAQATAVNYVGHNYLRGLFQPKRFCENGPKKDEEQQVEQKQWRKRWGAVEEGDARAVAVVGVCRTGISVSPVLCRGVPASTFRCFWVEAPAETGWHCTSCAFPAKLPAQPARVNWHWIVILYWECVRVEGKFKLICYL